MIERTITVVPEAGLHARPAARLTTTATEYDADVTIASEDGEFVAGNSMLAVTGLNVRHGETVQVRADGPEEAAAIDAIESILTSHVESEDSKDGGSHVKSEDGTTNTDHT